MSWERGSQLVLERNDDYWGEVAQIQNLVFVPIADGPARRQALEAGDIDGYDLVDPADVDALEEAGYTILRRPAFNVGYVGFNQTTPPLDNLQIRQAIAHAIDRENIISTNYPEGSTVATQFMPESVFGYADDVTEYEYDPEKAPQLIAESGVTDLTLEFWYPTDVSRPYMPDPAANFQLMAADLEAVGFTVEPTGVPWNPDFLDAALSGGAPMYLLGWTGDFGDPDNFVGTFFQAQSPEWGFDNPEVRDLLDQAEAETDLDARIELYEEANRQIMDVLPGLPYASTEPALAFRPGIEGFEPSPVQNENFNLVTVTPPSDRLSASRARVAVLDRHPRSVTSPLRKDPGAPIRRPAAAAAGADPPRAERAALRLGAGPARRARPGPAGGAGDPRRRRADQRAVRLRPADPRAVPRLHGPRRSRATSACRPPPAGRSPRSCSGCSRRPSSSACSPS